MATARVCRVIDVPAKQVYDALADWGGWGRFSPTLAESPIEPAGALPGTAGTVRVLGGGHIRERLTGADEVTLTISYVIEGTPPFPARRYGAVVRCLPLTDRDATVVDWVATFDADEATEEVVGGALFGYFNGFVDGLAGLA